MKTEFLEEEKAKLLSEFKQIESIEEKFLFWERSLNCKYLTFFIAKSNSSHFNPSTLFFNELDDFRIIVKEKDNSIYNKLVLDNYKNLSRFQKNSKLLDLDTFKNDFEEKLLQVSNKKEFIELEIDRLNDIISKLSKPNSDAPFDNSHTFFYHSFNENYLNNQPIDLGERPFYDIENLIAYVNGEILSKHLKFIKETSANLDNKTSKKPESLTLDEQFLVLDYLGIFSKTQNCKTIEKQARLISLLIGKSEQNCRALIPRLNDLKESKIGTEKKKIKERLDKVANLFEEVGLKTISKKVHADKKNVGV